MINVDISNIWGQVSLSDLLGIEREIFDAHKILMERPGMDDLFPTDGESGKELERILKASEKIRRDSDVLVVIGTGGCTLGTRAVIELLGLPGRKVGKGNPQILFTGDNLSTRQWNALTGLLEGKDYSLCPISGPEDALEPAIALRALKWMLERKYGTDEARKRVFAVTGGGRGALRRMAEEAGWTCFEIPEKTGGWFSPLSPRGLLPMAVAGIDIPEVLKGAAEAREVFDLRSYENPVWLYAASRNILYRSGKHIELLVSSEPGFRMMARWWQQLFAGTEGMAGKGLFPAYAELPSELHGLGQLLRHGERNLFETLIRFAPEEQKMRMAEEVKDLDGLNCLAGKNLEQVEEIAIREITESHVDAGVPLVSIDCGRINAETVGQLLWFFRLSSAISGYTLGFDPWAQPAKERYGQNMFSLTAKENAGVAEF